MDLLSKRPAPDPRIWAGGLSAMDRETIRASRDVLTLLTAKGKLEVDKKEIRYLIDRNLNKDSIQLYLEMLEDFDI